MYLSILCETNDINISESIATDDLHNDPSNHPKWIPLFKNNVNFWRKNVPLLATKGKRRKQYQQGAKRRDNIKLGYTVKITKVELEPS